MTLRERHVRFAAFALCALTFALAGGAACAQQDRVDTVNVVSAIPWTAPEAYRYVIVNSKEEPQGEGVFSVARDADGNFVMVQEFSDEDGNSDRSTVVADADTLRPLAGERVIIDAREDRRVTAVRVYGVEAGGDAVVRIAEQTYDPPDEDDPSLRCSPLAIDGEHYYDNDISLFLWRTITFEEGWSGTYTNVLANRRAQRALTVRVRRQERITTPAGTFDAWLVGIEGEGKETQSAWFATTPDHKLLIYNNREDQIFLYTGEADPVEATDVSPLPEKCEG
jgi:hypothetical protein